jgi:hypothetical protein
MDRRGMIAGRGFYRGLLVCYMCVESGSPLPQLHFSVTDEVASLVRQRARARKMTVSAYLATLVGREVDAAWPTGYFDEVVGGWAGQPLRRAVRGRPEPRKR